MKPIYFDYSSSTPIAKEVWQEMTKASVYFGNPSSIHQVGQSAKRQLYSYRRKVATLCNVPTNEIIFTSSATESNNLILQGITLQEKKPVHMIISPLEHPSIYQTIFFLKKQGKITFDIIEMDKNGVVRPENVKKLIRKNTKLTSITTASNEIGTLQPLEEIAELFKNTEILLHTDATQSVGTLGIFCQAVDSMTIASQKISGPKGVGMLYLKSGISIQPLIHGGGQEKGLRASTENLVNIAGFTKALELSQKKREKHKKNMEKLTHLLDKEIEKKIPQAIFVGDKKQRLCFHRNYIFPHCLAAKVLMHLDLEGICVSSGSACSSGVSEPSFALTRMGYAKEEALCSLRITFGEGNNQEQVLYFIQKLQKILKLVIEK